MICNRAGQGWEIIYQRAHALLAAKLLMPLGNQSDPRWFETLNAVAQHDHGWQEWQSLSALTSDGEPRNFLETPPKESERQARRAVECALHQSLWGGLLVARHVTALYRDSDQPCLRDLLAELKKARARWRKTLGIDMEKERNAYQFLNWADTFSLLLCLQPSERLGSVQPRLQGENYTLDGEGSKRWLHPWPYPQRELTVSVEAHYLEQETFRSERELAHALTESTVVVKSWLLRPGPQ